MNRKPLVFILIFSAIVAGFTIRHFSQFLMPSQMGSVEEVWETSNRTFKLQIERRAEENGGFISGAYYIYKSKPENSDNWQTIFIERHDDPNPVSTNSVRFIDSKTAYVFFGSKFAVTLDGGENWAIWDAWEADKTANFKSRGLYPSITDVVKFFRTQNSRCSLFYFPTLTAFQIPKGFCNPSPNEV